MGTVDKLHWHDRYKAHNRSPQKTCADPTQPANHAKALMRLERDHTLGPLLVLAALAVARLAAAGTAEEPAVAGWEEGAATRPILSTGTPWAGEELRAGVRPLPAIERCEYPQPLERLRPPAAPPRRSSLLDHCELDAAVRGYYLNDQRIEWSGQECSFGAEAVLAPVFRHCWDGWQTTVEAEFYLNQPFNRNILVDTPERASYAANFEVDTVEISKLFISFRRGDLLLGIGKMTTPFGRVHFPLFSNARLDAPFIRTEAILWRETGVLLRYAPCPFVADVALTNGSEDLDTNSSKALVTRLGVECPAWSVGVSLKTQDGIGSEGQKQFNNHLGMDFMLRGGPWTFSGEVIHDEYGFRRPGFDPLDITWGRSIYYRDRNLGLYEPITGVGYYLNLGYCGSCWDASLNYGEYHPQQLGDPRHDTPNRRGIVKVDYRLSPWVDVYSAVIVETAGFIAQDGRPRRGLAVLVGFQWSH